jgi:hypothetical protein
MMMMMMCELEISSEGYQSVQNGLACFCEQQRMISDERYWHIRKSGGPNNWAKVVLDNPVFF